MRIYIHAHNIYKRNLTYDPVFVTKYFWNKCGINLYFQTPKGKE